ncbi:predicted protein [Lichtheimia corymbifera JMRC:FSU:9682]|uniref:F-box domain-containing protein n=1 Tax=Lichtheimia corymbifera JMRC:FSU:9682 TaxID=1263082 RepID=A0A068S7A6_9FUNG|nr:predicted protein [Lichtheimia corymbifera JMRC:FSU:9682]
MEQGRYMAATHVYDTAFERVDTSDPLYDTIHATKAKAIQQGERRKDFIRDFPMEISDRIIQDLFTDEDYNQQREYVMVSSAWWHHIMATNHLECNMRGRYPMDEANDIVIRSFNYIRLLTLMRSKSSLRDIFEKYLFSSLAKLAIHPTTFNTFKEGILVLGWIGTQLTDPILYFHAHRPYQQYGYAVTLQQILEMCPNLISLYCHTTIDMSCIKKTYPKLQELKLYAVTGTVDSQHMMMIRKHLPGLKTLDMRTDLTRWERQQGLIWLSITETKDSFSLDHVAPLIVGHHATLQVLVLTSKLDTRQTHTTIEAMHHYRDIEFEQLTMLTMNCRTFLDNVSSYCDFISWVIERAPH